MTVNWRWESFDVAQPEEMTGPFYCCLHFVNGSLYHVGPPYRCCCYYYYYYYCRFCTVLIAGFFVLHSSSPFSLFLLYSLFPPAPHSLSKQLLPFLDIPELVTQISTSSGETSFCPGVSGTTVLSLPGSGRH